MNKITAEDEKELRKFVARKAQSLAASDGPTPLNPHRIDNLECTLWTIAVKAIIAHDPAKSPLVPFVKAMVNRSASREAVRELNRQIKAAENPWTDESLDAPITDEDGNETAFGDHVPEPADIVEARENAAMLGNALPKLDWRRQYVLQNAMFSDRTMEYCSDFLGITRPTFRKYLEASLMILKEYFTRPPKFAD